jgi:hypothetical protein
VVPTQPGNKEGGHTETPVKEQVHLWQQQQQQKQKQWQQGMLSVKSAAALKG